MDNSPIYYKDLLKQGNHDSTVGIVTLWTICDNITKGLDPRLFRIAGQLYTKNGINYLVRNLLADKTIHYLLVCGQDRAGSGEELIKIWETGDSQILDKEIPRASIKNLIINVKLLDLRGQEDCKKINEALKETSQALKAYGVPEIFPEPQNNIDGTLDCHFPSEISVFRVSGKTVAETWLKALKMILRFGEVKETDSMKIKELFDLAAVITDEDPDNFYLPDWLMIDFNKVNEYLPQIMSGVKFEGLHYTYGNRLREHFDINQIQIIIDKLKNDPNAREAVAPLFDPRIDHTADHRPCITLIQALKNNGKLNLNVYVRSHDIFGGWCLNAYGLRKLQKEICASTDLEIGHLVIISTSAHIYDFNWEQAKTITAKEYQPKFENDPRGYFTINLGEEKKSIIVKHYGPENQLLTTYEEIDNGQALARSLAIKLENDLGVSLIAHAFDLGIELAKAEIALKNGLNYTQNKPLLIP